MRTISSTLPPAVERPPYPDYWLMPPPERALSTAVGTNRINWDLRYDDPPGFNPDINNQMNSVAGLRSRPRRTGRWRCRARTRSS